MFCIVLKKKSFKEHIFWEGLKILWNLHRRFALRSDNQIYSGILQIFVASSEYMNFTINSWIFDGKIDASIIDIEENLGYFVTNYQKWFCLIYEDLHKFKTCKLSRVFLYWS